MQPVTPYRTRSEGPTGDESLPAAAPDTRAAPSPPDAADLPDLRDPSLNITQAFQPATDDMKAFLASTARQRIRDQAMQKSLDGYYRSTRPTFQTQEGPVAVSITFQMYGGYSNQPNIAKALNDPQLIAAAQTAGIANGDLARILAGRGTPGEIQRLTQELIVRCGLPGDPKSSVGARVRQLMFDHHIGMDCAGYVQGGFLEATGLTRAQAGFNADPTLERLDHLPHDRSYRSVPLGEVRPGDVGILGPPPHESVGHRVIVYDRRDASADDKSRILASGPEGAKFLADGPVSVFVVDSSWGCGEGPLPNAPRNAPLRGNPQRGGAVRATWYYNTKTSQWASGPPGPFCATPQGPHDHPLVGFYRRRDSESIDLPALRAGS